MPINDLRWNRRVPCAAINNMFLVKHSVQRQRPSLLYLIGSCGKILPKSMAAHLEKILKKATTILDAFEWDQKPLCLNILMLDWCICISAKEMRGTIFYSSFCFFLLFMESRFQQSSQKTVYDIWSPDVLLQNHGVANHQKRINCNSLKMMVVSPWKSCPQVSC